MMTELLHEVTLDRIQASLGGRFLTEKWLAEFWVPVRQDSVLKLDQWQSERLPVVLDKSKILTSHLDEKYRRLTTNCLIAH